MTNWFIPTALAQVGSNVTGETQTQLTGLFDFFVVKIPAFIAAFVVFVLFYIMAKAIKKIVEGRMADKFEEHKEMQILAGRTASTATIIIGATISLNIAGIDLTAIIAAAGFGVGFALKDIIINFLAGVMILAQKHFTIGDFIKIDGTIGKIIEIQTRATILQALDGTMVVVPNSDLFSKQVISYTSNPFRRIEIAVGVEYGTDLNKAVEVCYKALKATKGVLIEPKPVVIVMEFADSSINLAVRAWVESRGGWLSIRSTLAVNIKKFFDQVGINIPFPITTVIFDKDAKAEQEVQAEKMMKENPKWLEDKAKAQDPTNVSSQKEAPVSLKPVVQTSVTKDQPGNTFLLQNSPQVQPLEENS
ncbi:mechanosensitive ion channel [bacterium]|nr:mechanosensitive ion channel [bacterium]